MGSYSGLGKLVPPLAGLAVDYFGLGSERGHAEDYNGEVSAARTTVFPESW